MQVLHVTDSCPAHLCKFFQVELLSWVCQTLKVLLWEFDQPHRRNLFSPIEIIEANLRILTKSENNLIFFAAEIWMTRQSISPRSLRHLLTELHLEPRQWWPPSRVCSSCHVIFLPVLIVLQTTIIIDIVDIVFLVKVTKLHSYIYNVVRKVWFGVSSLCTQLM